MEDEHDDLRLSHEQVCLSGMKKRKHGQDEHNNFQLHYLKQSVHSLLTNPTYIGTSTLFAVRDKLIEKGFGDVLDSMKSTNTEFEEENILNNGDSESGESIHTDSEKSESEEESSNDSVESYSDDSDDSNDSDSDESDDSKVNAFYAIA